MFAYDLALLDITLPDGDGLDLAEGIRSGMITSQAGSDLRLVMLTARGGLPDRVRGLDLGADDYLVKPFVLAELTARLRAVLRRQITLPSAVLTAGPVRLDAARHLAHRDERELRLTLKEFGVLRYLLSRPGHLVSAEAARARLGRARRPVQPDRAGHRRHAASQADHRG